MKSSDRPEALLIASHSYVVPIYNLIKKLGLRIPEDIAIVAFDNSPYAEYLDPALTVFEQPIQHFTHNAMVQLKNIMTAQKIVSFGPTPSILVERKSCIQKVS